MPSSSLSAWLVVGFASAMITSCGGRIAAEPGGTPFSGTDASRADDAAESTDADASAGETGDAACSSSLQRELEDQLTGDALRGYIFVRPGDFLGFFQLIAQRQNWTDSAHGVDCTASGMQAGRCTYDPRSPRLAASDIHYSDADEQFVGPNGLHYIWAYLPDRSEIVVGDDRTTDDSATYDLLLEYNRCAL